MNTLLASQYASTALQLALTNLGLVVYHYQSSLHIKGTGTQEEDGMQLIESFDIAAGLLEDTKDNFQRSIQEHLDKQARLEGYDSMLSACSFVGAPTMFQARAEQLLQWRGTVWAYAFTELEKVINGDRTQPTTEALLLELPTVPPI